MFPMTEEKQGPVLGGHEVMGGPQDQEVDKTALKDFQRFVRLGVSNHAKLKKWIEKGDKLMTGELDRSDNEMGDETARARTKVNKLRRKVTSAVTQIYSRNPKFVGVPKRPILVPEEPTMDPMTGAMVPPVDPMTGEPIMKDISAQVAEVVAAIMDQIFMESGFKSEAKACTLEAHHRPASVMQVGYQYDEENKIDDVYFRWRSIKRLIIDPAAEVYNGVVRKCRFIGVEWSLRKDEAQQMGLDWESMRDRDGSDRDVDGDDDQTRNVFQVWSQSRNELCWISENAPRFAKDPEPWPWEIDGYPFEILKFTEDTDRQFSRPVILEAEGVQLELNEMRETMERVIVNARPVTLFDSDVIPESDVAELCGRRKYGWKGVSGLSGMKTPIEVVNEEKLTPEFFQHYERNEAEMDQMLGTSANEQLGFTGKTAREVEEVSKNAGTLTSGKTDTLSDFLNRITRKAVQIMRQTYDEERVTQITTRDGARYWVKWKGSEVLSEVDLRVEVGSTQSEDDDTKRQVALNLFTTLSGVPGISVKQLANDILREFGKKDTEQYWEQMGPPAPVPGQDTAAMPQPPQDQPMDVQSSLAGQMSPMV